MVEGLLLILVDISFLAALTPTIAIVFDISKVFQEVLSETDVPFILVNEDQSVYMKTHHFKDYDEGEIKETISQMEKAFKPLPIVQSLTISGQENTAKITQKLYYGETKMIKIIKVIPVIQAFIIDPYRQVNQYKNLIIFTYKLYCLLL